MVLLFIIIAAALIFNYGPYTVKRFTKKVDEWEEVLDSLKDEK